MPPFEALAPQPSRRRLLERGDLPGSDGGLYNPGAWLDGERIQLVVRREIDYRFTPIAHAERVALDAATLAVVEHRTLARRGFPDDARIEDFRPMRFRGETLCVHTMVHDGSIRPVLSSVTDGEIAYRGPIALPLAPMPIEKNWVLFEHEGELHCLYRLDPLTIYARGARGKWRLRKCVDNGWSAVLEASYISDQNFVDAYYETMAETRREFANSATLRYVGDNSMFTGTIKGTFNDFTPNEYILQSQGFTVSRLPEFTYTRVADDMMAGTAPGLLLYSSEYRVGRIGFDFVDPPAREPRRARPRHGQLQ